ncbi:MAG TPA: carbohydrate porin [Sinorhizobium sp.]|nr:carbohydrate porin [Sinorhizobium sp.]
MATRTRNDQAAVAITTLQFSDAGWVLTNLYWKQRLFDDRLTFGFGQIDVTDYVDLFALGNSLTAFQNLVFSVSPAIPAPNQGLGAAAGFFFTDHVYATAGVADANGDQELNFDLFNVGEVLRS